MGYGNGNTVEITFVVTEIERLVEKGV